MLYNAVLDKILEGQPFTLCNMLHYKE